MKTGTRLNKVAVLTGGFAFALMAGLSTVNANDQFTTEVESQNSRTKQDYYSQIGQGSPESVKATGAISVQSSTSINDAASNAQNVVNVTAQQVKADSDRKIRDLEDRLANAGGGSSVTTKTETSKVYYQTTSRCLSKTKYGCNYYNYNGHEKTATFLVAYSDGKQISKTLQSCTRRTVYSDVRLKDIPSKYNRVEATIVVGC